MFEHVYIFDCMFKYIYLIVYSSTEQIKITFNYLMISLKIWNGLIWDLYENMDSIGVLSL